MARFSRLFGADLPEEKLVSLENLGFLRRDRGILQATAEGRILLNSVLAELLPDQA